MAKKWENLCERNKVAVNNYNKKQRQEGNQQFLEKQKEYARAYYQRNKEKVNKHNSDYQKEKRKLAKADWDVNEGRSGQDFTDLLEEEEMLNNTINFSFKLDWKGQGDWAESDQYIVTLAEKAERRDNTKDLDLPEKAEMTQAITLDSIIKKKPQAGKPALNPRLLP